MDSSQTFGRVSIHFPASFAYPVIVTVEDMTDEFRKVMAKGLVGTIRLTDDEMDWLLGFDDDVTAHDAYYEAMADRAGYKTH